MICSKLTYQKGAYDLHLKMGILDLLQFKSKYIVPLSSFVSLSL